MLLGTIILVAIFAPLIAPYPPARNNFVPLDPRPASTCSAPPARSRRVLPALYGARSRCRRPVRRLLATRIAILVGMVSGYPRAVDDILLLCDQRLPGHPALPLMIVLAATPVPRHLAIMLVLVSRAGDRRTGEARQRRRCARRDFVAAAQFSGERRRGSSSARSCPNMTSLVAANFLAAATAAVLGEAGLEFLGLGDPSTVSWGTMLYRARTTTRSCRASGPGLRARAVHRLPGHLDVAHQLRRRRAVQPAAAGGEVTALLEARA